MEMSRGAAFAIYTLVFAVHSKAAAPCDGSNWTICHENLIREVFNTSTGSLPSRIQPDFIEDLSNFTMEGVPGPGRG